MSISGVIAGGATLYFTGGNVQAAAVAYSVSAGIEAVVLSPTTRVKAPSAEQQALEVSSEGIVLPSLEGAMRLKGNVLWAGERKKRTTVTSSGGKGGGGTEVEKDEWTRSYFIAFCAGPCDAIDLMWFDKKLAIDFSHTADAAAIIASGFLAKSIRFIPGNETQLPDPLIEAEEGVDNACAYRGICGVVIEDMEITPYGNRLPLVEARVIRSATLGVTQKNICSLTPSDPGPATYQGKSWVSDRLIYLWRKPSLFDYTNIDLFRSVDGREKIFIGQIALPTVNPWGDCNPVNTRDKFAVETIELTPGAGSSVYQALRIMFPMAADEIEAGSALRNAIVNTSGGGYLAITDANRFTTYDQDDGTTAYALRSYGAKWFGERVTIWPEGGAEVNYVFRTAGVSGNRVCCALTCAFGKVFAMIHHGDTDSHMHLHVINAATGALIDDFDGPAVGPSLTVTNALECLRTDGSSVWAYASRYVWKWDVAGTVTMLANNTVVTKLDSGLAHEPQASQQTAITDTYIIMQGEGPLGGTGGAPIFRHQLIHFSAVTGTGVPLADIVERLCDRRSVTSDVSELVDDVEGLAVTSQQTTESVLSLLALIYGFDGISQGDGSVYFRKRGGAPDATYPLSMLAAHDFGAEPPEAFEDDRARESTVPQFFSLNFTDPGNSYLKGNIPAQRVDTTSEQTVTIDATALALQADHAARVVDVAKMTSYVERTKSRIAADYRLKKHQPGDILELIDDVEAFTYRRRINKITDHTGLLQMELVADESYAYDSVAIGATVKSVAAVTVEVPTDISLLDISALRADDLEDIGFYEKLTAGTLVGSTDPWSGGQSLRTDAGLKRLVGSVSGASVQGRALTELADIDTAGWDEGNSVDVILEGTGSPASATREVGFAGGSSWLIGNEIVSVRRVMPLAADGTFQLAGLLRYQRATEDARDTHVAGERVVFLEQAGMLRVSGDDAAIGSRREFTAVTNGRKLSSGVTAAITSTGRSLKPFAPVNVRARYQPAAGGYAGAYRIDFDRRTRALDFDAFNIPTVGGETASFATQTSDDPDFPDSSIFSRYYGWGSSFILYSDTARYWAQAQGQPNTFYFRVAEISTLVPSDKYGARVGLWSKSLEIVGGAAPIPKGLLAVLMTAPNGTTAFTDSGFDHAAVTTVGAVQVTSNRAVFTGSTDALVVAALATSGSGVGGLGSLSISNFEIRTKFKTSANGVILSKSDASFGPGSYRVRMLSGRVLFEFGDFSATSALLTSTAGFADGAEHELRILQTANGTQWEMRIDGVQVAVSLWRNQFPGGFAANVILGNDAFVAGSGLVGTLGDTYINVFASALF